MLHTRKEAQMAHGLYGRKVGMTQIFDPEGNRVVVTVLQMGPCIVLRKKSSDGVDGYDAIQVGFEGIEAKRLNKPYLGFFKKAELSPVRFRREIRLLPEETVRYEVGQEIHADVFRAGEFVDVVGVSKGKGFQGVIKRHNFNAPKKTHGTHEYFRHGGSIGNRTSPGRVQKGRKMPGHMGNKQVTVENLRIVSVDAKRNVVLIKGGVPGAPGALVFIENAKKVPVTVF